MSWYLAPPLTLRERESVQLTAVARINEQIAYLLDIGVKTIETRRASAMHKLKLLKTTELVIHVVRDNVVQP
jgi:DNA-binding CsgD family transcriptional regulator